MTPNRPRRVDLVVDGATGAIKDRTDFKDRHLIDRIIGTGVAAHEGQLFGWPNQLLGLFTAMGLVLLCVSSVVMWWRRRERGSLGAAGSRGEPPFLARPCHSRRTVRYLFAPLRCIPHRCVGPGMDAASQDPEDSRLAGARASRRPIGDFGGLWLIVWANRCACSCREREMQRAHRHQRCSVETTPACNGILIFSGRLLRSKRLLSYDDWPSTKKRILPPCIDRFLAGPG